MKFKVARAIVSLLCASVPCVASCQEPDAQTLRPLQGAHIASNVPADADFEFILLRDLEVYFVQQGVPEPHVRYQLLRNEPTQSGVAYPKYYLWVSVVSGSGETMSGAARVAAIERVRFEITDYLSREDILANPNGLADVFPAALISSIRAKAHLP